MSLSLHHNVPFSLFPLSLHSSPYRSGAPLCSPPLLSRARAALPLPFLSPKPKWVSLSKLSFPQSCVVSLSFTHHLYSAHISLMLRVLSLGPVSPSLCNHVSFDSLGLTCLHHMYRNFTSYTCAQHHLCLSPLSLFVPLIWCKEDDVFIAKLPTFEKRCETPAGMVDVLRGLCI